MRNERFGNLLSEGISSAARRQRQTIEMVEQQIGDGLGRTHHTVQRWKRGHVPAEPEQIAFLARFCVDNGRLSPDWAKSILRQARYEDMVGLLQELFPTATTPSHTAPHIYQNLPPRYGEFLGREQEMAQMLDALLNMRYPLISLEGMGGMGKTTLALEVARRCLQGHNEAEQRPFTAVVWVSAKDRPDQKEWLNETLDTIARVLDYPYITQLDLVAKKQAIGNLLRAQPVLLIVDNFETIEDEALVQWLAYLPEPSKGLLTTRHAQMRNLWPIHLRGLSSAEALELIRRQAQRLGLRQLLTTMGDEQLRPLIGVTEGNPKAIEMALGYVKRGILSLPEVVDHLHSARETVNDVFDYLFTHAWSLLSQEARQLVQAVAFFVSPINKDALRTVAGLSGYAFTHAIGQLTDLSLLDIQVESGSIHYEAHPLVRAFARRKLQAVSEWEAEARQRWLEWYLQFKAEYGKRDEGGEWFQQYEYMAREWVNLLHVYQWCQEHGRYEELKSFWNPINFPHIYGYWQDLLTWTEALLIESKLRKDWTTFVEVGDDKAFTLALMGHSHQLEEAVSLLEKGWDLYQIHPDEVSHDQAAHVALTYAYVQMRLKKFDEAHKWGVIANDTITKAVIEDKLARRFKIHILYYDGLTFMEEGNFDKAAQRFNHMIELGEEIDWQRAINYAQNGLADIALAENRLEDAKELILSGLSVAERNRDRRRIPFYKRSYAVLEQKRENITTALRWAREALDGFTRLGMRIEIEEMEKLLQELEATAVI